MKGQEKNKSEFGIAVTIIFTHRFFTGHLNDKTVDKAPCRTPSANPRQLWAH